MFETYSYSCHCPCTLPPSFKHPHLPLISRHTCGIDNPGYIPDQPRSDDEQDGGGDNTRHKSSERPALPRPGSTETAWLEGSMAGPRQHYRAQETYFDCEFYIYGHKYQSKKQQAYSNACIVSETVTYS